jgi:CDP-diacylglycerol--serine O-phosphatidyltransferase
MATTPPVPHFSMIRSFHLADLLTIANGCCGIGAVFRAMRFVEQHETKHLYVAACLIPLAIVFDVLDGRVARWRHQSSPLGREMDSLADVISFGVAPAAVAFALGLSTLLDQAMLTFFAVCGLSRLARYNITAEQLATTTGKVAYFEGTPIPTSIVPLGILLLAFRNGYLLPEQVLGMRLHLITFIFVLSGSLMISKTIRIPKP